MKYLNLKVRNKVIEILLSKNPVNLPPYVTKKYICPYLSHICGERRIIELYIHKCLRCGRETYGENDKGEYSCYHHYGLGCSCWRCCGQSNVILHEYCCYC